MSSGIGWWVSAIWKISGRVTPHVVCAIFVFFSRHARTTTLPQPAVSRGATAFAKSEPGGN